MNAKIPLSKLAEMMAATTGTDVSACMQFVKDLFAIIEEEVSLGNKVSIPDLGCFTKSDEPGEPIAFEPDESFAAQLNEEFSMFSPVELHDGVTEQMLDEAAESEDSSKEEVIEEAATEPQPETRETEAPIETADTEHESVADPDFDNNVSDVEEVGDAPEPVSEQEPDQVSESEETTETAESIVTEIVEELTENVVPDSELSDKNDESEETTTLPPVIEEQPSGSEIPEQEEEYVVVRRSKSRFGIGLILGLIIGFALGVIAFIAYLVQYLKIPVENILVY